MKAEKQKLIPSVRTLFPEAHRKQITIMDCRTQTASQAKLIDAIQRKGLQKNFLSVTNYHNRVLQRTPVVVYGELVPGSKSENFGETAMEIMFNCAFKGGNKPMSLRAYQNYLDAFSTIERPTAYDLKVINYIQKEMDALENDEVMDAETDQDTSSEWSEHSLDEDDRSVLFASSSSRSKQPTIYQKRRHMFQSRPEVFKTSAGLSELVKVGHEEKSQYTANTHVMYYKPGTGERHLVQSSTVNSVLAIAGRFGVAREYNAVNNELKGKHCHTEMYLLWKMTGGDEKKVDNILNGYKLIVDKEICADCWVYVQRAKPDKIEDGGGTHTTLFPLWYNPFNQTTKRNQR